MKNLSLILLGGITVASATSCANSKEGITKTPNVIYFLADDLGIGDISCYGQQHFSTPNIDLLAKHGIRFTQHYAGSTVSAPSRSVLMTGQHTGHTPIRDNKDNLGPDNKKSIVDSNVYSMARLFKDAGYTTGAFGKWGLGETFTEGSPNNQGFDEFVGYIDQGRAHRYYPEYIWHNEEKLPLEGNDTKSTMTYSADVIQKHALDFIRENKDKSFFAYVPVTLPHAEMFAPDDEILAQFKGKFEEKPYAKNKDGEAYGSKDFNYNLYSPQEAPFAHYAAMVTRLDMFLGEIVSLVKVLGLEENTLIVFSSDNGCTSEGGYQADYFNSNGPLRGYKRDLTDGGIRAPMIASWKGKFPENRTSDMICAFWDILPTFGDVVNVEIPSTIDGISILPELMGNSKEQEQHDCLYWEFRRNTAVRMGDWKMIAKELNEDGTYTNIELYNIKEDIGETKNVASSNPNVVARGLDFIKKEHAKSNAFLRWDEMKHND